MGTRLQHRLCPASTHLSSCAISTGCTGGLLLAIATATPSRATTRCAGCCGRTSTAPSKCTRPSPPRAADAVATSRPPSALPSTRCAGYSTTPYGHYSARRQRPRMGRRFAWRARCRVRHTDAAEPGGALPPRHCTAVRGKGIWTICSPRTGPVGAKAVQRDPDKMAWSSNSTRCFPNGVGVDPNNFTWDELALTLAGQLYLVTVQHEILAVSCGTISCGRTAASFGDA